MMEKLSNLNTLIHDNNQRKNTKAHSTSTDTVNRLSSKCFHVSHTLFDNSFLVTVLTIGFIFSLLPTTTLAVTTSTYSGALSSSSSTFNRPSSTGGKLYYYQALQMTPSTSGAYSFTTTSSIDTYGCLYTYPFNPFSPNFNLIKCDDDDGNGNQFRIDANLQATVTYVLVITTYGDVNVGNFIMTATGPTSITFSLFTPVTTTVSSGIMSSYSGILTRNSLSFTRPNGNSGQSYYYQAIQIITYTSGLYTFISDSTIDTYGCFYSSFNPNQPNQNLITYDDDSAGNNQFQIKVNLRSGVQYFLVVTTYRDTTTGSFVVKALGPASIYMTLFTPVTSPTSTTSYSGTLYSTSAIFFRPNGNNQYYYYQAVQVTVYTTGSYSFTSISSMDTYGCLYNYPFDPSYPSSQLISCNDDGGAYGDGNQFRINSTLQSSRTYVLVVTTFSPSTTGSFSVRTFGPSTLGLASFTPSTSRPIRTSTSCGYYSSCWYSPSKKVGTIIGITLGSVLVFIILVTVCVQINKRKPPPNRQVMSSGQNQASRAQIYPMVHYNRNAPGANGLPGPYTISMTPMYKEEAPPTYDAFMAAGGVRQ